MNRTDRMLAIVLELQARRWLRAEDLARSFETSTRTIYRDMQALCEAGVPVVAVPGKGYSLNEGYLLPPLAFTTDEAMLLLLGSGTVAHAFEDRYRAAARAAVRKIEEVLPAALQAEAARLRAHLHQLPANPFDDPGDEARLDTLRRALRERHVVRFRYRDGSSGGVAPEDERTASPYGLVHSAGSWHLVAFCHRRRSVCAFRVSDVEAVTVLPELFEPPQAYRLQRDDGQEEREVEVKVRFDAPVVRWVQEHPSVYTTDVEAVPEGLVVTLRVRRETEVIPWLLGWGAYACVLEPATLRLRLAREAEKIAARYRAAPALLA